MRDAERQGPPPPESPDELSYLVSGGAILVGCIAATAWTANLLLTSGGRSPDATPAVVYGIGLAVSVVSTWLAIRYWMRRDWMILRIGLWLVPLAFVLGMFVLWNNWGY